MNVHSPSWMSRGLVAALLAGLLIVAAILAWPAGGAQGEFRSDALVLAGCGSNAPALRVLAEAFRVRHPELIVQVQSIGSTNGIWMADGWTVYFPGSSAATQDMALWGAAYKPDAMIFLMHPTQEPRDIGMAVKLVMTENPNLKTLLPHHHRVSPPPGAPTVTEVRAVLDAMNIRIPITEPVRKQVYEFTK